MSSDAKDIERGDTTRTPSVDQSLEKDANAAADSKPVGQKPVFPEGGTWGWYVETFVARSIPFPHAFLSRLTLLGA